ncbi:HEAT repeat domain-containing protein [candidate division KSB1 bacterium]|nr:HEAT repeat domain-containing protein [candidate division KSB1 bacterium]
MGLFSRKPNIKKLKSNNEVDELVNILKSTRDMAVREAAAQALGTMDSSQAVDRLIQIAQLSGHAAQISAVQALGRSNNPAVVPALTKLLQTENSQMHFYAVLSLIQINSRPALESFVSWIVQRKDVERTMTLSRLVLYGADIRIINALVMLLAANVPSLQKGAQLALVQIGAPAVDQLIQIFKKSNDGAVADTLVRMYQEGKLDGNLKNKIRQTGNISSNE